MKTCCFCGDALESVAKGQTFTYLRCPKCHWYSSYWNKEGEAEYDYSQLYDKYTTVDDAQYGNYEDFVKEAEHILSYKFKKVGVLPESFLDVGCSRGPYVEAFNNLTKYSGYGIDISKSKVDEGRQRGLELFAVEDIYKLKDMKFEFVYMRHVIEHIENPLEFILSYIEFVADGGILCIETPNSGDIKDTLIRRNKITDDRYMRDLFPPTHICGFTPKTFYKLNTILKNKGFSGMRYISYDGLNTDWCYSSGKSMGFGRKIAEIMGIAPNIAVFYRKQER